MVVHCVAGSNTAENNVPDGAGKKLTILRKNTGVKVVACPSDDWCLLVDPAGAAWGSFFKNN